MTARYESGLRPRLFRRTSPTWVASLACMVIALALTVGFAAFHREIRMLPSMATLTDPADGVVALTGGPERINAAAALLASGQAKRMLISGVNQQTTRAQLALETPNFRKLIDCCVDIGYLAENTFGNAVETARWARRHHIRRLVVVTSDYHMPRAIDELRLALPETILIAYPVRSPRLTAPSWWRDPEAVRVMALEYVKYLRTRLRAQFSPREA